jgi:hypothetical protein
VSCRRLHGTALVSSSVVNDALGEPDRTPLYVGLPSAWGSTDGDLILFPVCRGRAPSVGSSRDAEFVKALGMDIPLHGCPVGEPGGGGGSLLGTQKDMYRRLW